jgi:Zn-finger nucleic acid-binding protein
LTKSTHKLCCPRCEARLEKDTRNADLYLYLCPNDHGAWIDSRHIPATFKLELSPKHVPGLATRINHRHSPAFPKTKLEIFYFQGMEIEICPRSQGIWLDKDEILPVVFHLVETKGAYTNRVGRDQLDGWDWLYIVIELLGIFVR